MTRRDAGGSNGQTLNSFTSERVQVRHASDRARSHCTSATNLKDRLDATTADFSVGPAVRQVGTEPVRLPRTPPERKRAGAEKAVAFLRHRRPRVPGRRPAALLAPP